METDYENELMTQREHLESEHNLNDAENSLEDVNSNHDLQLERKDTTQTVPALMTRNFKENFAENQMNIDMISEIYASEINDLIDVDDTSIMRKLEQIEIFDNDDILAAQSPKRISAIRKNSIPVLSQVQL